MNIHEIQDELLRLEYPFLTPDYDPDIERYFNLRNLGRLADAMILYQTRLKPRYPQDEFRALLMRCYRSRDPAYKVILARAYRNLGERALERLKRTIIYIAGKVESYDEKNVRSTIKAADDILLALPRERYEAQAGIERLLHYAAELNFYAEPMSKAVELIRSYLNQSLTVVEEALSRRETTRQWEVEGPRRDKRKSDLPQKERESPGARSGIDLSLIAFSPEDLARIEIPGTMTHPEDQTLAFCVKYWNLVYDASFEQSLYFYSKKYGAKHHAVYLAIRRGRVNKSRDDEILASVMSVLVTGYYYSIRGDAYLQKMWNTIKLMLPQQAAGTDAFSPVLIAAPAVSKKTRPRHFVKPAHPVKTKKTSPKILFRRRSVERNAQKKRLAAQSKSAASAAKITRARAVPVRPIIRTEPPPAPPPNPVQKAMAARVPVKRLPVTAVGPQKASAPIQVKKKAPQSVSSGPASPPPVLLAKPRGSVSDRLRELSGRSYDVYQDRFLARARGAIRKFMSSRKGLFFNLPEAAEDLIYNFLKNHYADPYMNWEKSQEKKTLEDLGFPLDSLTPIIDECYRRL
jgi:hypothetical protein